MEPRLFSTKLQFLVTNLKGVGGGGSGGGQPALFLSGNLRIPGSDPNRPLTLTNSIVWGNLASGTEPEDLISINSTTEIGFSLVGADVCAQGSVSCAGIVDGEPEFAEPVDADQAREMLSELRGSVLLDSFRGRSAVDVAAVADVITRVSQLLVELPEIKELDLNPVLVGAEGDGCVAVDALVVV
jgi:hypothetical protein